MRGFLQEIEYFLKILVSYLIPIISFIISSIALYQSRKIKKIEEKNNELELVIKEYEVKKIEELKNIPNEPKIEARVINISKGVYKLKIWNSGRKRAYNIDVLIPQEYDILIVDDKLPYEYLDPGDSFEENVIVSIYSKSKFKITTKWEDENKKLYSEEQLRSI